VRHVADGREQPVEVDRLPDEFADPEPCGPGGKVRLGGAQDDRYRGQVVLSHLLAPEARSVENRHGEVEQDHHRPGRRTQEPERLHSIRRLHHAEAMRPEDRRQRLAELSIVVDDENGAAAGHCTDH
jgi:hypothetical protein